MECAVYYCDYRTVAHLGKEWRPVDCGMVMSYAPEARRVDIQVDPDRMDAWRKEPFFTQIKLIAENALRGQGYLIVWQGNEAIAVLPDREVNLGQVQQDTMITVTRNDTPLGVTYNVALTTHDDPQEG